MVRAERRIGQEVSVESRYFLLSFPSVKILLTLEEAIGVSKTACIGCLILLFGRMNLGYGKGDAAENFCILTT